MPSYDYRCKDCDKNFTVEKSMMDDTKTVCVSCNSENVVRVWGSVQLKGCGSSSGGSSGCGSSCSKSSCSGCSCG